MFRQVLVAACVLGLIVAAQGSAAAFTFSIDQGPAGSVPPYNDGTLLVYTTQLGAVPQSVRQIFVDMPVDALHIGDPISGLLTGTSLGPQEWSNVTLSTQGLIFSLDHGDPYPVGITPDSNEEARVTWKNPANPTEYITQTAVGVDLGLPGDFSTAIEANLGLDGGGAFDDDVDAMDTSGLDVDVNPIFFSVDDRITLVPNLPSDMRTGDIYVRFTNGGIAKVIDAVTDLGLRHDGDGPGPLLRYNDDIDALIVVELDDDDANNIKKMINYTNPLTGQQEQVEVDLGDGIVFSLDRETDLPYQDGGLGPEHHQASQSTQYVYFSSLGGLSTLQALVSHQDLGLSTGVIPDDIDALAFGHAPIPEPGTWMLLGTAALSLVGLRMRRRMKS